MKMVTVSEDALNTIKELAQQLQDDANRYRWLRDQNADIDAGFYVVDQTDSPPKDITWVGSHLDAAIDAAMSKESAK